MLGERINGYRIVRKIGQGGMGAVYEAIQEQIHRRAAIKILRGNLSQDPEIAGRFLNEARAVNIVQHAGVVSIYEHGRLPDGSAYIIMEYLDGEPLSARMRDAGRLGDAALRFARQIATALVVAHAKKIVHRDLKPGNIMLVPDGETLGGERVKIFDFGIAKVSMPGTNPVQTRVGTLMGTPSYMAPEQCRGADSVNDRADVYALGVILFEMISGTVPFSGQFVGEIMAKHIMSPPPSLAEAVPDVDPGVAELVHAMLAKEPAQRPSMDEVAAELSRLQGAPGPRAGGGARAPFLTRGRMLVLGAALLLLGGGTAFLLTPRQRPASPAPAPAPAPADLSKVVQDLGGSGPEADPPAPPPLRRDPPPREPPRQKAPSSRPEPRLPPPPPQPPRAPRTNPDEVEYFK